MTLHYTFPIINNIDDFFAAIDDDNKKNFVVLEKDDYKIVQYIRGYDLPDVVDNHTAIMREGRSLAFDNNGKLISRPFHKFFNYQERHDMMNVDITKPHIVMLKEDGSMIYPIKIGEHIRLATKAGVTDVAMQAEVFVAKNTQIAYLKFMMSAINGGYTPIFEWTSNQQRIVVEQPKDRLTLLAIRDNRNGKYFSRKLIEHLAGQFKIPVVEVFDPITDMDSFVKKIREREDYDIEGVVIQFEDGHMFKLKTDIYVKMHRAVDIVRNERHTISLILDEKVDDLYPLLKETDKHKLNELVNNTWFNINNFCNVVNSTLQKYKDWSKKEFATSEETKNLNYYVRSFCFSCWAKKCCNQDNIVQHVKKHLTSKSMYDKVQYILKGEQSNV